MQAQFIRLGRSWRPRSPRSDRPEEWDSQGQMVTPSGALLTHPMGYHLAQAAFHQTSDLDPASGVPQATGTRSDDLSSLALFGEERIDEPAPRRLHHVVEVEAETVSEIP